jgi:RNA polymerase sigma-70 factor, ECF subfamily
MEEYWLSNIPGPLSKTRSQYNSEDLSDSELVIRYREKHDLDILGVLYKRYMLLVYGVCLKYLKNRDDSQDAVMQIFETLIRDVPRFEIRNFKSWLYGVARNHCLMKLRNDIRERGKQLEIAGELFMESTEVLHPLEEEDDEHIRERLKTCLEQLKEEQRRCIELFYYQQHCYREIAVELMYDELKVKSFIQNGKRNLKICLESNKVMKDVSN